MDSENQASQKVEVANETGNLEQDCLIELKSLINECKELEEFSPLIDDRFLFHFVRGRKYKADSAFKTKENYSSLFKELRPSECPVIDQRIVRVLKNRDPCGRLILLVDFGLWDPSQIPMDEFCKAMIFIAEEAWNIESVEKQGVVSIYNNASFSHRHLFMWTLSQLKKCISLFWKNFPIRHHVLYVINARSIASTSYNIIKTLLPTKLSDRLKIFPKNRLEDFYEVMSKEILPESLGGLVPDESAWDLKIEQRIKAKDDHYENQSRYF